MQVRLWSSKSIFKYFLLYIVGFYEKIWVNIAYSFIDAHKIICSMSFIVRNNSFLSFLSQISQKLLLVFIYYLFLLYESILFSGLLFHTDVKSRSSFIFLILNYFYINIFQITINIFHILLRNLILLIIYMCVQFIVDYLLI